MPETRLIPWYSRHEKALDEVGDKVDASEKAEVQAELDSFEGIS